MEIYTIYITWVSDISRARCLVCDDWPFCSGNATMFIRGSEELTTRGKCYNRCEITGKSFNIIDSRQWTRLLTKPSLWFSARCAMMVTAPEKWLRVSAFFLRLVPVSSPLHFSWELMTPVMPPSFFFLSLFPFFPFLRKTPPLIPDIESNTRVSAFYSIISCLNGSFPSLWVCIGNVETYWNRLELKSSEMITYYH